MCALITGPLTQAGMYELFTKVHDTLPVFKICQGRHMVLYTPGSGIRTQDIPAAELRSLFMNPSGIQDSEIRVLVLNLLENAEEVVRKWEARESSPFNPECLTIHVGSDCNMNCAYCYASIEKTGNGRLAGFPDSDAIAAAVDFVTSKTINRSGRLTVAYHGSGEPSFHWDRLTSACCQIEQIAAQREINLFSYMATNGCIDEWQIKWLAEHMDLIGISCDGPPDIQRTQRSKGKRKYPSVEMICKRLSDLGSRFDIRVTVTPDSMSRLPEITGYLIENCMARNIRIEPVYLAGNNSFREADADLFYDYFIRSATIAAENGVGFGYSGVRTDELHSTYCDVLRNTVRLTVDGNSRNCFCLMDARSDFITGSYDKLKSSFRLRSDIDALKNHASRIPSECNECISLYHCSRGCPDFCLFENDYHGTPKLDPFRCRLHQLIAAGNAVATAKNHFTADNH